MTAAVLDRPATSTMSASSASTTGPVVGAAGPRPATLPSVSAARPFWLTDPDLSVEAHNRRLARYTAGPRSLMGM